MMLIYISLLGAVAVMAFLIQNQAYSHFRNAGIRTKNRAGTGPGLSMNLSASIKTAEV